MKTFDPARLRVTFFPPATPYKPIDERKYTFLSDEKTGEYFLTIGYCYDASLMAASGNGLLAEWVPKMGQYVLQGKIFLNDKDLAEKQAEQRFAAIKKALTSGLLYLIYGDSILFQHYPWLMDAPIYVQFESFYLQFNQMLHYGTPRQYLRVIKGRGQSFTPLKI